MILLKQIIYSCNILKNFPKNQILKKTPEISTSLWHICKFLEKNAKVFNNDVNRTISMFRSEEFFFFCNIYFASN